MFNLPLHPVIVHFPIVLALLAPLVAIVVFVGQRTGRLSSKAWWIAAGAWGLLAISSFLAVKTGEIDEEVVESVVAESAIETHEERAETFALSTYAVFVLSVLVMAGRNDKVRAVGSAVTLIAGFVSLALAVGVGHSGGSLVYEHNAAAAHARNDMPAKLSLSNLDRDDAEVEENGEREHRDRRN